MYAKTESVGMKKILRSGAGMKLSMVLSCLCGLGSIPWGIEPRPLYFEVIFTRLKRDLHNKKSIQRADLISVVTEQKWAKAVSKGCEPRPHYLEKPAIYTRFKTRIINGEAKKSI